MYIKTSISPSRQNPWDPEGGHEGYSREELESNILNTSLDSKIISTVTLSPFVPLTPPLLPDMGQPSQLILRTCLPFCSQATWTQSSKEIQTFNRISLKNLGLIWLFSMVLARVRGTGSLDRYSPLVTICSPHESGHH